MNTSAIRIALESALAAMVNPIDTAWENDTYVPVSGTPYQQVTLMLGQPEDPVVGVGFHREAGVLMIALRYPGPTAAGGSGPKNAQARADLIQSAFRKGTSLNGVTIDKTPWVGKGYNDVDRFVVPVQVHFFANIFE